jgi:flagellar basal-body rod protein FlgF
LNVAKEKIPHLMLLRLQNSYASMNEMTRQQERIANNLANAGTIGYRRDRSFTEALNERLDAEAAPRTDRLTQQYADPSQGAMESTGNPLDFAINGEGFFVLTDTEGNQRFTRAGRFTLDAEGMLRDPAGYQVEGQDGPIQFPPDAGSLQVHQNGEIRANGQEIGRLRVVSFPDTTGLTRLDGSAFAANGVEPVEVENPMVRQGFIEQSNVNALKEMTDMITHFRLFESQQKSIQTMDSLLGSITRDLSKF